MIHAYRPGPRGLSELEGTGTDLTSGDSSPVRLPDGALWLDLYRPLPRQIEAVRALGIDVPTLEEMEEIEISNRLYHEGDIDYMTVVLPGQSHEENPMAGPITFILTRDRLVTVRHHAPRPFDTYPRRAERSNAGCSSPERIFLGLVEEIVARLADLLEGAGRVLDGASRQIFGGQNRRDTEVLQSVLEQVGQQGELLNRVRLAVMTMERMLSFFTAGPRTENLKALVKAEQRDLQSLTVHADFLSSRISLTVDATLGLISLAQNATVSIFSVVAVLFLPPTLVASGYGMNFPWMPGIDTPWGFPIALALMVVSAVGTWAIFKWKDWL